MRPNRLKCRFLDIGPSLNMQNLEELDKNDLVELSMRQSDKLTCSEVVRYVTRSGFGKRVFVFGRLGPLSMNYYELNIAHYGISWRLRYI